MTPLKLKKALVVFNKPLYQIHILEKKDRYYRYLLAKKHPSTENWEATYEQHQKTLEGVQRTLNLLGIETQRVYRRRLKKIGLYDLVVTVGGDGTFLETSHYLDKQILLGVNAAPAVSTGALCRAELSNFLSILIDLLTGDLKPKKVPRLKVKVGQNTLPYPALNEILFANQSPAGTSRYLIQVGSKTEEHKSSGIWMSTGTGSTAAIRSAGGKPFPVTRRSLQYAVREVIPNSSHAFKILKGILPPGKSIKIVPKMRQAAVFIDGNHIEIPVPYGKTITVSSNGKPLKAIL